MLVDRRTPLAVFVLLLFSYAYINQGWGWNQNSRLDVLHALIVQHTVSIDAYEANTGDKEKLGGHFYSEKAPGMILIAAPAFLFSYGVLSLSGIDIDGGMGWKISERLTTIGSVGLLAALGGLCLFLFLRKRIDPRLALVATLAVFLGSLPFPYATMMFSHGATMGLLAIALWIFDAIEHAGRTAWKYEYLLGFLCGLAVSSEYPAAIAAGLFFVLTCLRGWRSAARFVAGSILPLLSIPAYNWAVSGSPLALGYGRVDFPGMQDGFFGVTLPRGEAVRDLLFGQFRGLFFWSPFLLSAFIGYPAVYRQSRRLFWLTFLVPLAYVLFASSYAYWDGGFAFGPRHLSPAVPFLAIPAAFGLLALPLTGSTFAAMSILLVSIATFINAAPPNEYHQPLFDFYPREFFNGKLAWNAGSALGLSGGWSMALWAIVVCGASAFIMNGLRVTFPVVSFAGWNVPFLSIRKTLRAWWKIIISRCSPRWWIRAARDAGVFRCVLWAALLAGLLLRFVHLPLMEFKADEFDVLVRAYRNAHGIEFVKASIPSSVGLFNPPFFVWLLSFPAVITSDPVLVTAFVAALNVIGMLLLYVFIKRAFSADIALWTTALLATAPWAILYSRKLWPQDVMILFLILFYWSLHAMMRHYRPWQVYLLFFSLAALTQLHLIAWLIPIILFIFLDVFRVKVRQRDLAGGLLLFALLYVPYVLHQAEFSFENLLNFLRGNREMLNAKDVLDHLSWTVAATSGLKFTVQIGGEAYALFSTTYRLAFPTVFFLAYAFGVVAAVPYLLRDAIRRIRSWRHLSSMDSSDRILVLFTVIWIVLVVAYVIIGAPPYTQYHIIFYPLVPLVFVLALQKAKRSDFFPSAFVHAFLLLVVLSNLYFSASFLHFLARNPEMIGTGYGKPYTLEEVEWKRKLQAVLPIP